MCLRPTENPYFTNKGGAPPLYIPPGSVPFQIDIDAE